MNGKKEKQFENKILLGLPNQSEVKKMSMDIILGLLKLSISTKQDSLIPFPFPLYIYPGSSTDLLYRTNMRTNQLKNAKHTKMKKAYNMYM